MKTVWEFKILQKFKAIKDPMFFTEICTGKDDLWRVLIKLVPFWKNQHLTDGNKPCVYVKVLSANKVCDLT